MAISSEHYIGVPALSLMLDSSLVREEPDVDALASPDGSTGAAASTVVGGSNFDSRHHARVLAKARQVRLVGGRLEVRST
jgi:hypothetical protein